MQGIHCQHQEPHASSANVGGTTAVDVNAAAAAAHLQHPLNKFSSSQYYQQQLPICIISLSQSPSLTVELVPNRAVLFAK